MSETIDRELTTEQLNLLDDFQHFAIKEFAGGNILPGMLGIGPNMHYTDASTDRLLTLIQILAVLIDLCGERSKAFHWLIDNVCYREIVGNDPYFCLEDADESAAFVMLGWLQIIQRFRPADLIAQMFRASTT
ncbi:hypothetical protein [Novosphingobium taihuense]|uniref:Uncharacterized protein n=1 Tax=Novosphingobium taihuense TaxID=260085 RepID=A0A7W7EVT6_9SPHN|nr:hypothetical protein [Novosphingobium taihuense]MBB4615376.1 hypothetical protein [Novosphingobium taihuense]TWH82173.1 hypothetical protein IQ25_03325 [Novosphingobium taihuense]